MVALNVTIPWLVVKGYAQQEGSGFIESFSPVEKLVTIKMLLAITAIKG